MLIGICNRHPVFLKTVYSMPFKLFDHERHVPSGKKYITYEDGFWRCWRMTPERVPIPLGKFNDVAGAIYMFRK